MGGENLNFMVPVNELKRLLQKSARENLLAASDVPVFGHLACMKCGCKGFSGSSADGLVCRHCGHRFVNHKRAGD
jgi:DNA-directed RNA polymerase subunit RPC12/RpoP